MNAVFCNGCRPQFTSLFYHRNEYLSTVIKYQMVCTYGSCISVYKLRFISVCVKCNFIWRSASFVPASHMKIEVYLRAPTDQQKKHREGAFLVVFTGQFRCRICVSQFRCNTKAHFSIGDDEHTLNMQRCHFMNQAKNVHRLRDLLDCKRANTRFSMLLP